MKQTSTICVKDPNPTMLYEKGKEPRRYSLWMRIKRWLFPTTFFACVVITAQATMAPPSFGMILSHSPLQPGRPTVDKATTSRTVSTQIASSSLFVVSVWLNGVKLPVTSYKVTARENRFGRCQPSRMDDTCYCWPSVPGRSYIITATISTYVPPNSQVDIIQFEQE